MPAEKAEDYIGWNERGGKNRVPHPPIGIARVKLILQVELKRRRRARAEVPDEPNPQRAIGRPVPCKPLQVFQRREFRPVLQMNVAKDASRPQGRVDENRRHGRGADKEQHACGGFAMLHFEALAQPAAEHESDNGRYRSKNVPDRADLPGHGVLLAESGGQSILSAGDAKRGHRQQQQRGNQAAIADRREREGKIKAGADGAENRHQAAILYAKRIPRIAQQAENKGQIKRNADDQAKARDFARLQMQLVLQEKADRNVHEPAIRIGEGDEKGEAAKINERRPALGGRQWSRRNLACAYRGPRCRASAVRHADDHALRATNVIRS